MSSSRSSEGVSGTLQYLSSRENATYYATKAGEAQAAQHDGQFDFRTVWIRNARQSTSIQAKLDQHGFELVSNVDSLAAGVKNVWEDDELEQIYNPIVTDLLLKTVPGARRIHIFDHTRRASSSDLRVQLSCREPSSVIHNDYTKESAHKRLQDVLGEKDPSKCSFAIVNVWRSIAGTVETWPMAFCDATTIDEHEDLVSVKRVAKDRIGEIQMALYNPKHVWFYYPEMQETECLVFKTYDSRLLENDSQNNIETRCATIHTAFDDPSSPADAPPRQSIETRAFVFFDDA